MAYLLPHFSPSLLISSSSSKSKPNSIPSKPIHFNLSSSSTTITTTLSSLQSSTLQGVEVNHQTSAAQDSHRQDPQRQRDDFYLNLGLAVRTLREDLPLLFSKDLNYDIYRDDITFVDPLNTFTGIDNYKLIFWALRFHGRILFREICLEIFRVWQPSENVILIRWNLKGVPRVPWEAKGEFQGTSRYKLDRNGKIYQHKVDNLAFNFPQPLKPAASVLDLVTAACPASPNPTFLWNSAADSYSSSWLELYRAVRETLDRQEHIPLPQDGFITCS